ncbi:MAG: hypothetical protein LBL62_06835 [Planctomycetaceae bacterium]|jgi:uncharacterized membrane protein|nr:hypothetical protein [Planctomycetaceae bacterium]
MSELIFAQGYTLTQLFVILFLAWGITTFFYWRTFTTLTFRRFMTLLLLRYISIAAVILLLFRPMLQYTKEQVQRKSIVFAVDTSASMGISDGAGSVTVNQEEQVHVQIRVDQVKDKIKTWSAKLEKDFLLHLLEFSDQAVKLPELILAQTLKAEGTSTSLSAGINGTNSIMDGKKKIPTKEIEALFLFSDGQNNTARDPVLDVQKLGIPVYSIGVGTGLKSSSSFKDVQTSDIRVPERLTYNNKARITAGIDAVGLEGRTVKVILEEDTTFAAEPARGKKTAPPAITETVNAPDSATVNHRRKIGEQELMLDAIEGPQDVVFEFKPEKVGRTLYIVRAEPLGDEAIRENNERQTAALVVEPGMRVFYLEGTLRPEYGAISQRYLAKDPDIEFCAMVQIKPNIFEQQTNIEGFKLKGLPTDQETIDSFDVFIIGDIDSSYFKTEIQEMIVKRIRNGAGLIMLGGYHSLGPGGYGGTPIGKVLPVIVGNREIGQFSEEFLPKLTPDGVSSNIFANISAFFPSTLGAATREGLPMLTGCTRIQTSNPAATIFATCPNIRVPGPGGGEMEMPVLAAQPVDQGRTVVFTGDTTRRWQQGPRAMNQDTPFMQFWGQLIRYVAGREGAVVREAGVSASIDKAYYEPEETVTISATVKNADGEGTEKASVSSTIIRPDGKKDEIKLEIVQGTPGKYTGIYEPKTIGQQEIQVTAKIDGLVLNAPEKMIFDVGRPNMEFDRLDLNEELMTKIADASGGRYSHITTADFLIDQLNRDVTKRKVIEQIPLAPPFSFWAIFVTLLTIEWILRRHYHLR